MASLLANRPVFVAGYFTEILAVRCLKFPESARGTDETLPNFLGTTQTMNSPGKTRGQVALVPRFLKSRYCRPFPPEGAVATEALSHGDDITAALPTVEHPVAPGPPAQPK